MFSKRVVLLVCSLVCLFALTPTALFSQAANSGSIAGTVLDAQGAAVTGASVTITDTSTNIERTAVTNETGRYVFVDVPPGTYNVAVSKTGFRVAKLPKQVVSVGLALTLNVSLEVGAVTESIEVIASGADLQTLNATVGNTISGDLLQDLPSIQRDATTFVTLQPGVSPDGSVAGAVVDQSTFMLDGGQNSNDMDGSMTVYTPTFAGDPSGGIVANQIGGGPTGVMPTPLDSVEEFKVDSANQTADFNSSAGADVKVVTKRGTNAWHGTGYEYYFDNGLNANTWDNNANADPNTHIPQPRPYYHYNRFGAAGGGPIIPKDILGGKTYFFANYEGFRWNNAQTYEVPVPSADMRAGILHFDVCNAACQADPKTNPPVPTTFNLATGTNCGSSANVACDPRGMGINSLVAQLWSQLPPGNDPSCGVLTGKYCDGQNEIGFKSNVGIPYTSNFGVARLDHDFGSKWHFNTSYRYYKLVRSTLNQVAVGGAFTGNKPGASTSLSLRPQQPWYLVAGLTTNITPNTTNDFHYSYLRNFWSWGDPGGVLQFSQLGAALEPMGESTISCGQNAACPVTLGPYNVNTQSVRTRFWDGHDNFIRDDITMLKGSHLFTFGGAYQRNWDYHQRSDNGGGINYQPTYQLGDSLGGGLVDFSSTNPAGVTAANWARDSAAVLGIVTDSQIAYTRSGPNLTLNPPLTHAFDQSTIPYYNVYFSDSWHMKPTITLSFGLGWTLEMPPTEANGKQVELVDSSGQQLDVLAYLKQRKAAALQGQVFNPPVGFALVGNTGAGQKYPYNPFYGAFSPRISVAWNPNFDQGFLGSALGHGKSVIRGGYSRIYGRLNGVNLVLVPLLGTGLIQAVQCGTNVMPGVIPGTTGPQCATPAAGLTLANAFRIGTDGNTAPIPNATPTLPQPVFPGINNVASAAGSALDPHYRPNAVDSFDFTIQRQLTSKVLLEVGYIGRRITNEFQPININAVPYMMTLGGQRFDRAYAAIETALGCATSFAACGAQIPTNSDPTTQKALQLAYANSFTPQAFFENALGGLSSAYCSAFSSCTAAVVYNEEILRGRFTTQRVWSLWSDLDRGAFIFPRSMLNTPIAGGPMDCGVPVGTATCGGSGQMTSGVAVNTSTGHGNYNGLFISTKITQWKGITLQENFTWSKTLGTGALVQATSQYTENDPFNLNNQYGLQTFDRKFVFNSYALIEDPWYKSQQGIIGHIAGGWSLAPIFAVGSGEPIGCLTNTGAQSFGSADGRNFFTNENCIFTKSLGGGSASLNPNSGSNATQIGFNIFGNADAVLASARPPILGLDNGTGGIGILRGLMYWNVDMRLTKDFKFRERMGLQFQYVVTNVFNHPTFADPNASNFTQGVDPTSPAFGVVNSQGNNPRQMQFGLRFTF
jgi:Carboxypeptidase regulatory-like domain